MALSGTLNFISASEYGVSFTAAAGAVLDKDYTGSFGVTNSLGARGFIPVDFVGMNTIIYEPLTSSAGVLGYNPGNVSGGYHPMSGANFDPGRAWTPFAGPGDGANTSPSPRIKAINDPALLFNALMLHRNGAYGYPTWKQIRTGDHPVARYQKKHGSYSIINPPRRPTKRVYMKDFFTKEVYVDIIDPITGELVGEQNIAPSWPGKPVPYVDKRINFREPNIVSAYKPMRHVVSFMDYSPAIPVLKQAIVVHSYQNMLEKFISSEPLQILNLPRFYNKKSTIYNKLVPGYLNEDEMPVDMVQFTMAQTIFPSKKNTYKHYARTRPVYEEPPGTGSTTNQTGEGYDQINYRSFWRNKQKNRARTDNQSFNSMGTIQSTGAIGGPIIAAALSSTFGGSPALIAFPASPGGTAAYHIAKYIYQSQQYGYSFAATSKWPLDPRKDIGAKYLLGGVGATPNSPNEEAAISSSVGWASSSTGNTVAGVSTALGVISDAVFKGMYQVPNSAGTVTSASVHGNNPKPDNVAGELVYNTAPTLFNLSASVGYIHTASYIFGLAQECADASDGDDWGSRFLFTNSLGMPYGLVDGAPGRQIGYATATASLLYQMHNFPWRQPYWATDKIIDRGPFYDSYEEFSDDIKYIGQGYSVLPEFRISQHMDILEPFDFDMALQKYPFLTLDGHILSTSLVNPGYPEPLPPKKKKKKGGLMGEVPLAGGSTYQGDLGSLKDEELTFPGLTPVEQAHQNTFFKTFSHSEFMNTLEETVEEHGGYTAAGVRAKSVILTCNAIKKVLPYNGFFPSQRTVQIASLFSESIGKYLLQSGTADMPPNLGDAGKLQTALEPFFAPGIVYNSIKSGIAVSYPIFTGSALVLSSTIIHESGTNKGLSDGVFPFMMNQSVDFRLPFEAIYDLSKITFVSGTSKTKSKYADKHVGHIVLPNLYKVQNGVGDTSNYHADRSNSVTYEPNVTISKEFKKKTIEKTLYEKAMHNFLAETPRFFLKQKGLTKHVSKPNNKMLPMFRGIKYYMDVVLSQGQHQIMAEGPRERYNGGVDPYVSSSVLREFEVLGNFVTGTDAWAAATTTDVSQFPDGDHRWLALNTTTRRGVIRQLDMSSSTSGTAYPELQQNLRGCIYGHPMITSSNGFAHSASERLRDPAWAAYTPPYFYGKSTIRMCFDPDQYLNEGEFSRTFTLKEIQQGCKISQHTHYRDEYDTASNFSTTKMKAVEELKSPVVKSRMKIRDSVELYGVARTLQDTAAEVPGGLSGFDQTTMNDLSTVDDHWVIYPKWECPVLDFSGSKDLVDNGAFLTEVDSNKFYVQDLDGKELVVQNTYHDGATGKGMWSGYGQDPYQKRKIEKISNPASDDALPVIPPQIGNIDALRDKGVYLSLEESYPENLVGTFVGGGEKSQARLIMPIFHNSSSFDGATIRISDGLITKVFEFWGQRYNVGRAQSSKMTDDQAIDQVTGHILVPITPAGETPSVGGTMESLRCALTGTYGSALGYPYNRQLAISVEQKNLNEVYPGADPPATTNISGAVLVITATSEGEYANGPILINRDVTGSTVADSDYIGTLGDASTGGEYFPINPFSPGGIHIGGSEWLSGQPSSTPDKPVAYGPSDEEWQKGHQFEIFENVVGVQGFWGGKDPDQFGIKINDPDGDDTGEIYRDNEEWRNYRDGRAGRGPGNQKPTIRGSLIEVCGFEQEQKPIGQMADSLTVSEAVVCIPFTKKHQMTHTYSEQPLWAPPPAHLFKLNPDAVKEAMHCVIHGAHPDQTDSFIAVNNSQIARLIRKMRKFVLPPHLDWVGQTLRGGSETNPSGIPKKWTYQNSDLAMSPFPMLIFDFEHTFGKQELMDIWQGVMPHSSMRAQKIKSSVTVGGTDSSTYNIMPNGQFYPHDTHWMVFKAKQRADNEYHNLTPEFDGFDQAPGFGIIDPNFKPKNRFGEPIGNKLTYSYNWPYDFFTMLELVKLESEITLK